MKILYLKNKSIYTDEVYLSLSVCGHTLSVIDMPDTNEDILKGFAGDFGIRLATIVNSFRPDVLFGIEFYPAISDFAQSFSLPYYSWILSMQSRDLYNKSANNDCNTIFISDKEIVNELKGKNIGTVRYMPYGVPESIEHNNSVNKEYELSFVGSLYPMLKEDEYEKAIKRDSTMGYIDGMVEAQRQVLKPDLFKNLLPNYVIEDLVQVCPPMLSDNEMDLRAYYAERFFYNRVGRRVRTLTINTIGMAGAVDVFTDDEEYVHEDRWINHGKTEYRQLDDILGKSLISLNLSPYKIKSGISPHAWHILGSGALLITDLHEEFNDFFDEGKDLIMAKDTLDMANKAYAARLYKEDIVNIAKSGYEKAIAEHKLTYRLVEIFKF